MSGEHRLSASKLTLARHCLYSFRGDVNVPFDKPGPAAKRGTAVHAAIERFFTDGTIAAFPPSSEEESYFAAFLEWHDTYGDDEAPTEPEAAYRIDVRAGTAIRVERDRAKRGRPGPSEITVVVDLVQIRNGVRCISDFKTGKHTDTEDQLATGALAVALAEGPGPIAARAVYVWANSVVADDWTHYDAMDIDAQLGWLRDSMRRLPMAERIAGTHCKSMYCLLRQTCPAHRAYLKEERMSA